MKIIAGTAAVMLFGQLASAQLVITEVMAQTTAGTAGTINGDWWELTNTGASSVNLSGYQWADTEDALPGTDSNFFPAFVIEPGQSIIILEEPSANAAAWRQNWNLTNDIVILGMDEMVDDSTPDGDTFSGLGSGTDAVFFYDPAGVLLSSYAYADGAVSRGTSFAAGLDGSDLGLSVVGVDGAVTGANGDIGSPGSAVPAPAALSAFFVALAGVFRRRR